MGLVSKLDDIGKPAWLALMIGSFIVFWPLGLAILFYLKGSGRMSCWKREKFGRWHGLDGDRVREKFAWGRHCHGRGERREASTGNAAFDEYRVETLKRLGEEQKEFRDYLEKLRHAKDKAEFDRFMADRRPAPPHDPAAPSPA